MAKFYPIEKFGDNDERFSFECPGCGNAHYVQTNKDIRPHWLFNGDLNKPTVSPSILVRGGDREGKRVCHSFIEDGQIRFLGDCTHELAGQTVELPEW